MHGYTQRVNPVEVYFKNVLSKIASDNFYITFTLFPYKCLIILVSFLSTVNLAGFTTILYLNSEIKVTFSLTEKTLQCQKGDDVMKMLLKQRRNVKENRYFDT